MPPDSTSAEIEAEISSIKVEADKLPPEWRLMVRYIEVLDRRQSQRISEIIQAYQTAKGTMLVIKWLAGFGAAIAAMYAAVHGSITIK
ncbi:MAG: hypothetical protein KGI54_10480 [Pseudomonadota bacterium]|nr:hypothetical protein [Pseudomonadota bacterium]